jgi:hypothetical protein
MRILGKGLALLGVLSVALPARADDFDDEPAPSVISKGKRLEGGLAVGVATEGWSHSMVGSGPRLDVGLGVGKGWAIVVGEAGRFSLAQAEAQRMMVFDLVGGVAYGAPYQARSGFGAVAYVGAERLSTSATVGGLMTWAMMTTAGVRASFELETIDIWIGVDGVVRSSTIESGRPEPIGVPAVSAVMSVGCFFPAFAMSRIVASR